MITTFKTFKTHLDERRRSEKISGQSREILAGHQSALDYFQGKDLSQYGVTMTNIPKVGVNPQSSYDTPLGVYFYPAKYYVDVISGNSYLPFQHAARYINILYIKTNKILYLDKLDERIVMSIIERLKIIYPDNKKIIDNFYSDSESKALVKIPAGRLWYVLFMLASLSAKPPYIWNSILRKLGYDCVIDPGGLGIIHDNEKNAGFFTNVSSDVVDIVKRFDNIVRSPLSLLITTLKNQSISDNDKIDYMNIFSNRFDKERGKYSYPLSFYNHYNSENIDKKDINKFSDELKINFFKNILGGQTPTIEKIQIQIDKNNGDWEINYLKNYLGKSPPVRFIQDLVNPSDFVLKAILEVNIIFIHYMKNPSKEVQIMAVKNNLSVMKYIENPSPEVIKYYEANK